MRERHAVAAVAVEQDRPATIRARIRSRIRSVRRRTRVRRAEAVLVAAVVGLVGAWLGMALLAKTTVPMGPFLVELDAGFGKGDTHLGLPPFGTLTADTHLSPLALSATLQDVGVQGLTDAVNEQGIDGVVAAVEADARERVPLFAWQILTAGTIGAAALALLTFRSHWRLVGTSVIVAVLGVAGSEVMVLTTFTPAAFTEPTYSGSLALAPQLIGPVREATNRIEDFRAGLAQLVDGATRAYATIQSAPIGEDAITVLHVSDIHASPLGMDFAIEVARGFDVDFVIDTGDLTSFGTSVENLIVKRIPEFGRPYVFVRGSHDPISLQAQVAALPNGIILDGHARTVDGLTIYGLGDPSFTPARGEPVDTEEFEAEHRAAGAVVAADLDATDEPVDLIAVHDDLMAEAVAGRVPVVISGHFHATNARVLNGSLFLRLGTTGGSGAGIFRGLEDIPFSAEVLYFSREEDPQLIAYDIIEQLPDSGSLTVQRIIVAEEYGELVLTPTPTISPTGPTGATGISGASGATGASGTSPP